MDKENKKEINVVLFKDIVENTPDMIFVKDAKEFRFILFNKAGQDILGYSQSDLYGKNDYDFFPKEQADFFVEKDRAVINSGVLLDIPEEPIETKFKGKRILHTKKIPIFDDKGDPLYLLGISEDITGRKIAEDALKRQQEDIQIIFDSIPAWIFFKDKENKFIQVNKSFCEAMGVTKEQLEGKSLFDFFPKEQADVYWKDDKEVIASGKGKTDIIEPLHTSQGMLWVKTDKIPFRDTKGDIIGVIGFSIDITAEKKFEDEKEKKNQEVETMNKLMVGRELRMIELKKEVAVLEEKIKKLEK